jgi:hypothetical protein
VVSNSWRWLLCAVVAKASELPSAAYRIGAKGSRPSWLAWLVICPERSNNCGWPSGPTGMLRST